MQRLLLLLIFGIATICEAQQTVSLSGYVTETGSREQLPGVNVYIDGTAYSTSTNNYGFYSLQIPKGEKVIVRYSFVGFKIVERSLTISQETTLNVELELSNNLDEVEVSAKRLNDRVSDTEQMSQISLPIQQIKKIPALLGEKDVLKVLQLMPGVQKGSEGQSGIYVRGGGPDQNLLILDEAPVYNANHLFGFFSVFNGDAIKSVELTKGGFPARYGGRLSSVIELQMKDGNKEEFHGEGGIGIISSRLTLEGPIQKGKSSFLVSGRRTYIDVLAKPIIKKIARQEDGVDANVGYYFYDLNAKFNHEFSEKDKVYLSGYFGKDVFYADIKEVDSGENSGLDWGNATATARWNHLFSSKLFANTSLIFSKFNFGVGSVLSERNTSTNEFEDQFSLRYDSRIRDIGLKVDFDYFPSNQHAVKFGVNLIRHRFEPSAIAVEGGFGEESIDFEEKPSNSLESAIYVEDVWQPLPKLKINGGLRISGFQAINKYYVNPEPRLALAYKLNKDLSVKGSYAIMNQYIHLLSNTGIGLPTDLWVPTTSIVKPQQSQQVAIGLARDFENQGLTLTVEGYYKKMDNIVSYKEGATFLSFNGEGAGSSTFEDRVTQGQGWSYGGEFMLQKKVGKFSGWVGYTLSWTQWQFDLLNFGEKFYPRYDRRHDLSLVGIYELSKRVSLSATWVYGTGNALTLPLSNYNSARDDIIRPNDNVQFTNQSQFNFFSVSEYGERNSFRAEAFHRLDVAVQIRKQKKHWERTWEFGLYNAYNRRNPFFYITDVQQPTQQNQGQEPKTVLKRVSLFPVIPSVSYSFKF
ncbi:TonB dependent receptor [Spirosomataceae bacterium TFI 002]|nr:TonB dependent receptor [Spirosomataceae bacterium TFI 002]